MLTVKIKEVALKLFCKQGYEYTTMRQIAKVVGIKAASIYNHFAGKKQLFLTILQEIINKDTACLHNQLEYIKTTDITLERYLFQVFRYYIFYYKENKEEVIFLINFSLFPPEVVKEEIAVLNRRRMEEVNKELKSLYTCLSDSNTTDEKGLYIVQNYFGVMAHGYLIHIMMTDIELTDEEIEEAWGIMWKGLNI